MKITEKVIPSIDEKYTFIEFDCGLKCCIIPKKRASSYAVMAVNFGSCDTEYADSNGNKLVFPYGTAHFLEHKMFSMANGDAFELYAGYGGDANAYTAPDRTCYLFSATDNFSQNLGVLISHVTGASFDDASVNKEKGIILQEMKMYLDKPKTRVRNNMLKCLFGTCALSEDPVGTEQSINATTREILYECRKTAYSLDNMLLCLCGDIDINEVIRTVEAASLPTSSASETVLHRVDIAISDKPVEKFEREYGDVSLPVFAIGIKLPVLHSQDSAREFAAAELVMDMLFGASSEFYSDCYNNGLFEYIYDNCQTVRNAFYAEITGVSSDPEEFVRRVASRMDKASETGFSDDEFERARITSYSDKLYEFDSAENLADTFVSYYFEGDDMFDSPSIVAGLTKEYVESIMRDYFKSSNICFSVIYPKKEKQKLS